MGVVQGLAAYKARQAEQEARRSSNGDRPTLISLQKDGDSVVFRFAQEIDFDAKNYNKDLGIGLVAIEHVNGADPKNGWKNRGNCSIESQGACYPCEKVQDRDVEWANRKGWKQKERFVINVIAGPHKEVKTPDGKYTNKVQTDIDRDTGDGEVYVLSQGTYNGIFNALAEIAVENESITDTYFKITRKGSGFNDTSYILTQLKPLPEDAKALTEFELVDLEDAVLKEVPYASQQAFYWDGISRSLDGQQADEEEAPAAKAKNVDIDPEW